MSLWGRVQNCVASGAAEGEENQGRCARATRKSEVKTGRLNLGLRSVGESE